MNNLINLFKQNLILENKKSWPIGNETIEFIFNNINEKTKSIETGIGYSTFIFAYKQASHSVIFPDKNVEDNVRNYAKEYEINLDNVKFIVGKSEDVLPTLKNKINFALIDGDHKFPNAMVDFFYINNLLEKNGIIVIDDLQINSVAILFQFLRVSSKWNLVGMLDNKRCCAFQKIKDDSNDWFGSQEFNSNNYFYFNKNTYIKM